MRRGRRALGPIAGLLLAAAVVTPASAAGPAVDLALVLALDSSASVDADEFALQRGGLAMAFRDREVAEAIAAGPLKRIAVAVVEWAGASQQVQVVDWTLIEDAGGAMAMADRIDGLQRAIPTGATSIAGALAFGTALLRVAPFEATRRVIDLSGDGRNNQGQKVEDVRRVVLAQGVVINGLAILNEHPTLNFYFQDKVIGGAGSFVEIADDYGAYVQAIRRKLIREIRSLTVSEAPGAPVTAVATSTPATSTPATSTPATSTPATSTPATSTPESGARLVAASPPPR